MEDNKKEQTELLVDKDDASPEHAYIKPSIELKLPAKKRTECREIVREIREFGISQRQLLYLIYLLSLELENVDIMKSLTGIISTRREEIPVSNLVIPGRDED